MKYFILSFSIGLFGCLDAQTSFFIRPMVNSKFDIASSNPRKFSDKFLQIPSNFFEVDNQSIITTGWNSIDWGISTGAKMKDGKILLELGVNSDATGSGNRIYHYELGFQGFKYPTSAMYINGRAITRVSLQGSFLLNPASKFKTKWYWIGGTGFGYKRPAPKGKLDADEYSSTIDDNVYLQVENYGTGGANNNFYLHTGLAIDLVVKKTYLGSFQILLNKGFKTISQVSTIIDVYDHGNHTEYLFGSYSKGSGIYFMFSRRLQFYPWIKRNSDK